MGIERLARNKDGLAAMQSIVSMATGVIAAVAIVVGAVWFLQQGQVRKRLVLSETLKVFAYDNDMHQKLLSVSVIAENTGHVPVHLTCERVQITEISPAYKREWGAKKGETCNWTFESGVEIDPGEKQQIYKEFYIPDSVKSLRVSTSLPDVTDINLYGWTVTETIVIPTSPNDETAEYSNVAHAPARTVPADACSPLARERFSDVGVRDRTSLNSRVNIREAVKTKAPHRCEAS